MRTDTDNFIPDETVNFVYKIMMKHFESTIILYVTCVRMQVMFSSISLTTIFLYRSWSNSCFLFREWSKWISLLRPIIWEKILASGMSIVIFISLQTNRCHDYYSFRIDYSFPLKKHIWNRNDTVADSIRNCRNRLAHEPTAPFRVPRKGTVKKKVFRWSRS